MTRRKGCSLSSDDSDITKTSQKEERFYVVRRTNEDKRKAVQTLLDDPEWGKWSDNEIAKRCNVTQPFVSKLKKDSSLITVISDITKTSQTEEKIYTDKHGNESVMN